MQCWKDGKKFAKKLQFFAARMIGNAATQERREERAGGVKKLNLHRPESGPGLLVGRRRGRLHLQFLAGRETRVPSEQPVLSRRINRSKNVFDLVEVNDTPRHIAELRLFLHLAKKKFSIVGASGT